MQREEFRQQPPPPVKNPQKAKNMKKRGEEPMREALFRMSGVDLTGIDAIGVETVQVVLSEYGPDLSRFSNGETVRITCDPGTAQAHERRQAGEEEEAQ